MCTEKNFLRLSRKKKNHRTTKSTSTHLSPSQVIHSASLLHVFCFSGPQIQMHSLQIHCMVWLWVSDAVTTSFHVRIFWLSANYHIFPIHPNF